MNFFQVLWRSHTLITPKIMGSKKKLKVNSYLASHQFNHHQYLEIKTLKESYIDDYVSHKNNKHSTVHPDNMNFYEPASILSNWDHRERQMKSNIMSEASTSTPKSKVSPKPIQRPKSAVKKISSVYSGSRQDSGGENSNEERHLDSRMGSLSGSYNLWDGTTDLNNILHLENLKQLKDSNNLDASKIPPRSYMYPEMAQVGPGNLLRNSESSLVAHNPPENHIPMIYRSHNFAHMGQIPREAGFVGHQGLFPQFNIKTSSTIQVRSPRNTTLYQSIADDISLNFYKNKVNYRPDNVYHHLTHQYTHPWGSPPIQSSWANFPNHQPFEPLKSLHYNHNSDLRNTPQSILQGKWRTRYQAHGDKLGTALKFFQERIFQPQNIGNNYQTKQQGILDFFDVLRERLTRMISREKMKSPYVLRLPEDFVNFVVYAVEVPEKNSQVKEQLETWIKSSDPRSSLSFVSNYALRWIDDQERSNGNKNKGVSSKALLDWHYEVNSKHYEMKLNRSSRNLNKFIKSKCHSNDHIFYELHMDFDFERQKIENEIQNRIRTSKENWFMPRELSDYVALAIKQKEKAQIIKSDLKRWMASGDECPPISRICKYSLSWLERLEIFAPKDYKTLLSTDGHFTPNTVDGAKESDYRKRLDTAYEYWEDLVHMPWDVKGNDKVLENFVESQFTQSCPLLDVTIKHQIEQGGYNDHMDQQFVTYVASALQSPEHFNTVKQTLESWMNSANKESAVHFKVQFAAKWLQEKKEGLSPKSS
ncbi:hypothetical protein DFH28DRAFT_883893 [Melampsora americana]|nr:hypothetical protein DFH28DRAFT_883893 [Melampsora americana]